MVGVHCGEVLPLLGQIILGEDGLYRTRGLARSTIDTLVRMDIEHLSALKIRFILPRVNAVNRANVNTSRILGPNAGFSYYISHLNNGLP
jgi:hypothetical protein